MVTIESCWECLDATSHLLPIPTFCQSKMVLFLLFFLSSDKHLSHHLVGCHSTSINSLLISFLHALHCLNLFRQATGLICIIVSGSSLSKLSSSRLMLLRIHWRFLKILKTSNKSVWSNAFSICKIVYTLKVYSIKHKF